MEFQIPTVTEEDLRAFHAKHFPNSALPAQFIANSSASVLDTQEYEDDGLGCYPDGVKRTLTDEQVHMFRHSEIQALLRERREQEELKAEQNDDSSDEGIDLAQAREKLLDSLRSDEPPPKKRRIRPNSKPNKPQKHRRSSKKDDEEDFTPNRVARELDEVKHGNVDLDYD